MAEMTELLAKQLIRDVPDFPKAGIMFKDIAPVLECPEAFAESASLMSAQAKNLGAEAIVGIESRGFLFGVPISLELGLPFVLARKLGKLPYEKITEEYALEYGTNTIEMHIDSVKPGQKVYIVDDLLATGGTAAASARLVEKLGGEVVGMGFLVELSFLSGRENLQEYNLHSLIQY